jgi:hypothetical protein
MDDTEGGNQITQKSSGRRVYKLVDYSFNLENILRFYYFIMKCNYFKSHT